MSCSSTGAQEERTEFGGHVGYQRGYSTAFTSFMKMLHDFGLLLMCHICDPKPAQRG